MKNFAITYHAIERIKQRFPDFCGKIPELNNWQRNQGVSKCKPIFNKMILASKEDKSYLNNTAKMVLFYEKYGYEQDYKFMLFDCLDLVFIMSKSKKESYYKIVTVVSNQYVSSISKVSYKNKLKEINNFIKSWNNITVNKEENALKEEIHILNPIIKDRLLDVASNQKSFKIKSLTKNVSLERAILDECEYDFIYDKETKIIEIQKSTKIEGDRLLLETTIPNKNTPKKTDLELLIEKNLYSEDITRDFKLEVAFHIYNDKYIDTKIISSFVSYFKLFINGYYYEIVNDKKQSKINILSKTKDELFISVNIQEYIKKKKKKKNKLITIC